MASSLHKVIKLSLQGLANVFDQRPGFELLFVVKQSHLFSRCAPRDPPGTLAYPYKSHTGKRNIPTIDIIFCINVLLNNSGPHSSQLKSRTLSARLQSALNKKVTKNMWIPGISNVTNLLGSDVTKNQFGKHCIVQ